MSRIVKCHERLEKKMPVHQFRKLSDFSRNNLLIPLEKKRKNGFFLIHESLLLMSLKYI